MGSQNPANNDRSRTYWTTTMERYFVDLMLEHMHRGNRIGHTFNKQAWTDMLAVFNAKFGSQYDKDVLKSRYTNMWKQFNDIKNLLNQNGFCWDENRQMVEAEDHVWDAYIKVHPDASQYKTKTMLNFNDLCVIYEYTSADGRYSLSSHDVNNDDELQGVNLGDGVGTCSQSNLNNDRSRTDWTNEMDQYFIDLMLNQLESCNKFESTFSKQAWSDMLELFNAKYGSQHSKRVLRHRFRKLWKYYSDVTILLQQNGFSWNDEEQMVIADDDSWYAFVKGHPLFRFYRKKVLPNYYDLGLIFGDIINNETQSERELPRGRDHEDDNIAGPKIGAERPRTFWTPSMDHYFIDLIVHQAHRGNRIGQTFIGEAWLEMVNSFNANFKSNHDKYVIKSRYKYYRRQYNDVKNLLEQIGFSWNEKREMVMAEDHVWDNYIKDHPDARSYRVKTVPSYNKLRSIYGQDSINGRSSRLAHKDGCSAEISDPRTGEKEEISNKKTEAMMEWTPSMDRFFIEVMLIRSQSENKIGQTFDPKDWSNVTSSFNEKLGLNYSENILEDRFKCLTNQYIDVCNILERAGFDWDESQQIISAENRVWDSYIQENPQAILYRGKILGGFSDLCTIFGKKTDDQTSKCPSVEPKSDGRIKRKILTFLPSCRASKVQKIGTTDEICEAFSDVANVVSKLVKKRIFKSYGGIERAIDALQAIPDIDDELMLDACDLLEDERRAKTFLALDTSLRKKWLLRKLGR